MGALNSVHLGSSGLGAPILLAILLSIFKLLWAFKGNLPKGVPWPGIRSKLLGWPRASLRSMVYAREMVEESYYRYTKQSEHFILPNFLCDDVVVPRAELKHLLSMPDEDLNLLEALKDQLQPWYTLMNSCVMRNFYTVQVPAVRYLDKLVPPQIERMMEEVGNSLTLRLGDNPEAWRDISVFDTVEKVVSQVGNFFVVGDPLCRNEEYIQAVFQFGKGLFVAATFIRMVPKFLRPIFGPLIAFSNRKNYYTFAKHLTPLITQRLNEPDRFDPKNTASQDVVQWFINRSLTLPDPRDQTPEFLTYRLMLFSLAVVQVISVATTHLLFDLYSFPPSASLIPELRDEILEVLKAEGGTWTMHGLNKMVKLDSAIKESMRLSCFGTRGCTRKVIKASGITLSNGLWVPNGATITTPLWSIHHDEDIYPHADQYVPFRFYNAAKNQVSGSKSIGTTSPEFLSFGHGRHACPGRYFAAVEMKLLVAYLLLNYDVEPLVTRPPSQWIATNYLPPMKAVLRVKRRRPQ
ncbi:MAG: hypothetical protein M1839_004758 [Geoglossum umbratile]|nr:MAG: hypothetical protein M1839_004758 [Geoglossum umbratile]